MTRTFGILTSAGVAPQIGLAVSLTSLLPVLQVISLSVGIVAGLSMLYFGWRRELRHQRNNDIQQAQARDFLAMHRRQHHVMSIENDLADAGFTPDAALPDIGHESTHHTRHDQ